ncbi:hypothetical protein ACO0LF_17130 [Undibacterium sp. Di27W]|uniref:hypothetical protein n=1 Tax=Undibacterium sp. Di27W TaxID=3413036 RepID=UPI003BF1378C
MNDIIQTIQVSGFYPEGAPEIHINKDNSIVLEFSFMPPSDVETDEEVAAYDNFDEQIEAAIGTSVIWEDRELFIIESPGKDTVELLSKFISGFRSSINKSVEPRPWTSLCLNNALKAKALGLKDHLGERGFQMDVDEYRIAFSRKIEDGNQKIFISHRVGQFGNNFSVYVSVSLVSAQKIAREHEMFFPPEKEAPSTGFSTLYYFLETKDENLKSDFPATTEKEFKQSFSVVETTILNRVLDFLDQSQDVKSLDAKINSLDDEPFPAQGFPKQSYSRVILARLAGNPRFDDIVEAETKVVDYNVLIRGPGIVGTWNELLEHLRSLPEV